MNYAHVISAQNSLRGFVERQSDEQAVGEYRLTEVDPLVNKAPSLPRPSSSSRLPPRSFCRVIHRLVVHRSTATYYHKAITIVSPGDYGHIYKVRIPRTEKSIIQKTLSPIKMGKCTLHPQKHLHSRHDSNASYLGPMRPDLLLSSSYSPKQWPIGHAAPPTR